MPSIYIKAKKRTEKPLEAKNKPKASQEPSQELKTQETAPKAKSQEQIDLETIQKLDKQSFLDEKQAYELKSILERLNLEQDIKTLETLECERIKNNKEKISTPYLSMQNAIRELDKLTAQEKAKKEQKDAELKRVNEQQKEMERQKAQGKFNYNSTKSQSQEKGRKF